MPENKEAKKPFVEAVNALPPALRRRFLRFVLLGIAVSALFITIAIYAKKAEGLLGVIFSAVLFFSAHTLVRKYEAGMIANEVVVCLRSSKKGLSGERKAIVVISADAVGYDESKVKKYDVRASAKELDLLTDKTVLSIYYDKSAPYELLAWEIVGAV